MAERRMFTKKVTEDDNFSDLSSSAQALYLHLSMAADDDGFCNQVSISMFRAHASVQDLAALLEKRFIYQFENGVIVISHWRMANALRKDRYTPTVFQAEAKQLGLNDVGVYEWLPSGCQMVASCLPQDRLGKDSIDKNNKEEDTKPKRERFVKPSLDDVKSFISEKGYKVDAESWYNFYESNGWKVGKNSMKNWQACIAQWNARNKQNKSPLNTTFENTNNYDFDEIERLMTKK